MKRRILILFITLLCSLFCISVEYKSTHIHNMYHSQYTNMNVSNNYNSFSNVNQSSNVYSGYNTLGYTTVSYGKQNTFNVYSRQYNYNTKYSGTYTPGGSTTSGPKPRKITVYNGSGETNETPGGSSDPDGVYQYDESTDTWYYSPDGGTTWYEYRKASGIWELFIGLFGGGWGEQWRSVHHPQTENTSNWASDPDDPFLTPIGKHDMLYLLAVLYVAYKLVKRKKLNSLV